MKKLLILLLVLPLLAIGQRDKKKAFLFSLQSYNFTYTTIPSRPTLGTSATLTWSSPGNILNSTGGTTQDKIISGTGWNEFHAFSFVGTSGAYQRISNEDASFTVGSIANNLTTKEGTNSTYFEYNGLSPTAALYFVRDEADATSAIQLTADAAGPYFRANNIVNDSRGYAFFANTSGTLSGGNATTAPTSTTNYQDIELSYIRSFNPTGNKEHVYVGATTTSAYAIHQNFSLSHFFGYQSTWDGMQFQNAKDFTVSNVTVIDAGSAGTASQDASLQVQNSYGTVSNSIFMGAPQGFRFSTLNLTVTNCYFQWTGNKANEIISYYGNYAATNRLMVNPITTEILIQDCDFDASTWTGALMNVLDPDVTITVTNCRIRGATSLFQDSRGMSPTGALVDGGGNTFGATIPTPTFTNFTPSNFDGHGKLTEQTHHELHRGYRTP